jgi:Tfp pilus assembly protein PilX
MKIHHNPHSRGFALVATVSMMVLLTLVAIAMLSLSTIEQRSSGGGANDADRMARANARMALMIALGELQKAAGPDQRVSATASILGSTTNPYATGTTAADGRKHWLGVWNTNGYSPADPDTKTFVRWLVSGDQDQLDTIADAGTAAAADDVAIFEGVDAAGNADPASTVKVPKVEVATATPGNSSYYAYWVEDEGVKVDLAWNEGNYNDTDRQQAARLSTAPGPDHAVFEGPFSSGVSYPLEKGSGYVDDLEKAFSSADMPLVMGSTVNHSDWLKANRHNMAMNVRGVMADVKKGGLRRDLSLAFEMDGDDDVDSEGSYTGDNDNLILDKFNQQIGEFVAGNDGMAAPLTAPGMTVKDRFLYRDFLGAGNFFSTSITGADTVVRGPSWWLLRDYANLYKRLKTSGNDFTLDSRAYFPNRTTRGEIYDNLIDIHANDQFFPSNKRYLKVHALNKEQNTSGGYAFRPIRANYAPVLLGVNAIYSLVYADNKLQMSVDPFFVLWNPYNTQIEAQKFAITLQNGLPGGIRFRVTRPDGTVTVHGKPGSGGGGYTTKGTGTGFSNYASQSIGFADLSYLATDLTMQPGEVLIYSPPKEKDRSLDATVANDEIELGINYSVAGTGEEKTGIFFDQFPDETGGNWTSIEVGANETPANYQVDIMFNLYHRSDFAIVAISSTNLPDNDAKAKDLTTKAIFGDHIAGKEYRLNVGTGNATDYNYRNGPLGYTFSYKFSEIGVAPGLKESFGISSMLTLPTDHPLTNVNSLRMEPFSHLNATPVTCTNTEYSYRKGPPNIVSNIIAARGINNLLNIVGFDISNTSGDNGFYGKSYQLAEGDTHFPLINIPRAPLHSLIELTGANIGTRLLEPTHAIGNSWKPPYIPTGGIYSARYTAGKQTSINDVSWQTNDALFDRYYLSGIAPAFTIGSSGYVPAVADTNDAIEDTLQRFYGIDPVDPTQTVDPATAKANPVLEPHVPAGKTSADIVTELTPSNSNQDGYKKIGAYSLIKGAFNVNSTSVKAWRAFLQGNKDLALESVQGTTDSETGTPFPLASTTSAEIHPKDPVNGVQDVELWEEFSRLTDAQIDTLAQKIVEQVKARGPFMSLSDFVNRRVGNDSRSYQGAIQEAIEQAGTNGNQTTGIRDNTSETIPNYELHTYLFPFADDDADLNNTNNYLGSRNNATGVPLEVNQANILLPLAPRLSARSDTFRIRAYGEVRDADDKIIAQATCEAVVQRLPEYVDPNNNDPWDDDSETPTLNAINQTYGRKFEIQSFRWLDQSEV